MTQLRRGPCRWQMFFSCVGFAIPAMVHLSFGQHLGDWLAAFGLICVSVTSPLCDAFCVDSGVYDDGSVGQAGAVPYSRTAACTRQSPDAIERIIKESLALPLVLANDQWNNLTRLIDRLTCVVVVLPCVVYYAVHQRPDVASNLPFVGGFLAAWAVCFVDQRYRYMDPCGTRYVEGRWLTERTYAIHQQLHELWHYILIVTLTWSACYRPAL